MAETLLTGSTVLLYGRKLVDLTINTGEVDPIKEQPALRDDQKPPPRGGDNKFLQKQLETLPAPPNIARIYGFAFEGHYYDLAKPALFIVHGEGKDAEPSANDKRAARAPGVLDRTGVAGTAAQSSEGITVWAYDKSDLSLRLDTMTGTFEQILLEAEVEAEAGEVHFSGGRVGGGRVGGGRVGGGRVGGGRVGGGRVGGGRVGSD